VVAARQICAANAVSEKHISSNKKSLFPAVKTDTARRVPRQEENFQLIFFHHHRPAGNEVYQFAPVILEGHPPLKPHRGRHCKEGLLLFVEMEGQVPGLPYELVAENVIQMAMSVKQPLRA